jgi:Glycosyltransferases involved in cell wall biogenesis
MSLSGKPLVSIITPSYQQAAFLEQTMRSVLDQDYPNIEYIVVDGGSSDGSLEIIQKYAGKLAWWVSEKDNGQAEAINKGVARAKGEIIAWVNSDDLYLPGAISEAVKILQQNPEAGFVFGNVRVLDAGNRVLNELHYGRWGLRELMSFHIIGQPAVFIRRSALPLDGFLDPSYHFLLDHQLWLRIAINHPIVYQPQFWAAAHYHQDAKNLAQAAKFGVEALRMAEWMKTSPQFAAQYLQHANEIIAGAERINGFYLLDAEQYQLAFKAYMRAFFHHPGTALQDWYRVGYALLAPLGLKGLKQRRLKNRARRLNQESDVRGTK